MTDPTSRQAAFNASSREQWLTFTPHRERVSTLLCHGADSARTRLCVLGAGNSNDLDLGVLLAAHREVHLVDLDAGALERGAVVQGVATHPGLRLVGGLDVTAMLDVMAAWTPLTTVDRSDLAALAEWPCRRVTLALPGPFDLVASTCLLSQLIDIAFQALGDGHRQFGAVLRAVRAGHLRLLAQLAAPGGEALLISDVVSSDHYPRLSTLAESALASLLPQLATTANHIHGVHPADLVPELRSDPILRRQVAALESVAPWRWRLHARDYLVWGVRYCGETRRRR